MEVFAARVGPIDATRHRSGVPTVDRPVELQARIRALPGRLGDLPKELAGRNRGVSTTSPVVRADEVPIEILEHGVHELVGDPDGVVRAFWYWIE